MMKTIFLLTANSGVDGDGGRGNVTSQLDTSIVNRCIGVLAPPPSAKFEREMVHYAILNSIKQKSHYLLSACVV